MKPFQLLTVIVASMIIISLVLILIKDDVLQREPEYLRPPILSIRDVDVKPVEVTSSQIELNVTAYMNHAGGDTKNASLLIKAINSGTRLLETQVMTPFSAVESGLQKTLVTSGRIKVERNGGYELMLLIFDNGTILDSGSVSISGLNALTPLSRKSGVVLNNIDFMVSNVSQGNVAINSDLYFENRGPEDSDNLKVIIKLREATSNLLADKTNSETGIIPSEATVVRSVRISVPDNYNYMEVVELWRGDVLINTWEKPVLLAPTKTVPKESIEKKLDLEVSQFIREKGEAPPYYPIPTPEYGEPRAPGFGALAVIMSLILLMAFRRRILKW